MGKAPKSTQIGEAGKYTITTNSFLVCQHGGVIMAVSSGQETVIDENDIDKEKNEIDRILGILPWEEHTIYGVNPYKKWDTYGDFKMESLKNTAALENSFDVMWSQSDVRKDAVKAYEEAIKK